MVIIPISGIIADWEMETESNVTPMTFGKSLNAAAGDDALITINSPGGSVWHGLEMFSLIRNYPGNTETRVVSLAASMGSVLALAGQVKSIEKTAMYYIHNAQGGARGDYRELLKASAWLRDVSRLIASLYQEHTTLTLERATKLMDEESQFFGKDLAGLGFKVVETGNEIDESVARVQAVKRIGEISNKIPNEEFLNDLEKVAASIADKKGIDKNKSMAHKLTSSKNNNKIQPATGGGQNKQEDTVENLTMDELKAQNPNLYNKIFQAGVAAQRKRVSAHLKLGLKTGAIESSLKFIEEDRSVLDEDVQAEYMTASMNKNDLDKRELDNQDTGSQPNRQDSEAHIDAFVTGLTGEGDLMLDDVEV